MSSDAPNHRAVARRPAREWRDAFAILDERVRADGVHVWSFDRTFPVDVQF